MTDLFPLQLLLATFAGWTNRQQGQVIEYLVEENRVLKEQLGGKRLRLSDDQRRQLAAKGKAIGSRLFARVATSVTPDTILRWHRRLVAEKRPHRRPRTGRPGLMKELKKTICRMAQENSGWGYARIRGELKKLGHKVARTTRGLFTHYTLFVIQRGSRRVHAGGTTANPDASFMAQVARNLTNKFDGFLRSTRHLILDRDTKFTEEAAF